MKKYFFMFFAVLLGLAHTAFAHVKWFVNSERVVDEKHGAVPFYYLGSKEVWVWALISIIIVVIFSILDRVIPEPTKLVEFGKKHRKGIVRVCEALLGLFLVTVSVIWNIILIPELPIHELTTEVLEFIQIFAGVLFMFGVLPRLASVLVVGLYVVLGVNVGFEALLENLILLSLLVFFFVEESPENSRFAQYKKYGLEIVRVGTGISLIVLAFSEKLMYPELGLEFLKIHHWNFMHAFGVSWFSNNLFVLSTGFAELIFGVIFILGYLTRINTVAIAFFFAMSVVTMFVQFGQWEVEDLVVYAAAVLFVFFGHGETKFFHIIPEEHPLRSISLSRWFKKKDINTTL